MQENILKLHQLIMKRKECVYKVHIKASEREAYFTSVAAIFEVFTPAEIGCSKRNLWDVTITPTRPFANEFCTITRHLLHRKQHIPRPD